MTKYQTRVLNYLKTHNIKETARKFDLFYSVLPTFCMSDYIHVYSDSKSVDFYVDRINKTNIVFSYSEAVNQNIASDNLKEILKNNNVA